MITIEEAKKRFEQGEFVAGMTPVPDFVISARTDNGSGDKIFIIKQLENLLNSNLHLKRYTDTQINNLIITFIVLLPYDGKGVDWKEKKVFNRKRKEFYLELSINNYNEFCNSEKDEALRMIATETIHGVEKYLSETKEIDYKQFHKDLVKLFMNNGLVN